MIDRREARAILKQARQTLRELNARDGRTPMRLVRKTKWDALVERQPRLRYAITENARPSLRSR